MHGCWYCNELFVIRVSVVRYFSEIQFFYSRGGRHLEGWFLICEESVICGLFCNENVSNFRFRRGHWHRRSVDQNTGRGSNRHCELSEKKCWKLSHLFVGRSLRVSKEGGSGWKWLLPVVIYFYGCNYWKDRTNFRKIIGVAQAPWPTWHYAYCRWFFLTDLFYLEPKNKGWAVNLVMRWKQKGRKEIKREERSSSTIWWPPFFFCCLFSVSDWGRGWG